jgi:hypothetical protein
VRLIGWHVDEGIMYHPPLDGVLNGTPLNWGATSFLIIVENMIARELSYSTSAGCGWSSNPLASLVPPRHIPFTKWRGGIHYGRQKGCRRCIMKLLCGLKDKRHCVVMDNYFYSIPLYEDFVREGPYLCNKNG